MAALDIPTFFHLSFSVFFFSLSLVLFSFSRWENLLWSWFKSIMRLLITLLCVFATISHLSSFFFYSFSSIFNFFIAIFIDALKTSVWRHRIMCDCIPRVRQGIMFFFFLAFFASCALACCRFTSLVSYISVYYYVFVPCHCSSSFDICCV